MWDEEPRLFIWKVETWEHAAKAPKSFGQTPRLRDSKRLLPPEITAPIYAALAEAEKNIFRVTDPIPPFNARLLRMIKASHEPSMPSIDQEGTLLSKKLSEIVPDWDKMMRDVLGEAFRNVQDSVRSFASLGIPRGDFSVHYGYRISYSVIAGRDADRRIGVLRDLLMGCGEDIWPPGVLRDAVDALMR